MGTKIDENQDENYGNSEQVFLLDLLRHKKEALYKETNTSLKPRQKSTFRNCFERERLRDLLFAVVSAIKKIQNITLNFFYKKVSSEGQARLS